MSKREERGSERNRGKRESGGRDLHYTGLCNLHRVLLFVLILHPCSAMDQTDRQSLIGFWKEFNVCVCVCVCVCVYVLPFCLLSQIFPTPLVHNSCLYFSRHQGLFSLCLYYSVDKTCHNNIYKILSCCSSTLRTNKDFMIEVRSFNWLNSMNPETSRHSDKATKLKIIWWIRVFLDVKLIV